MKRIISIILTLAMLLSIVPNVFAAEFSDFNSSHWAYEYVSALVNDGTINGYADGTFRPEGTVTRAEFVKMIGNGPETRKELFDDVSTSHWAYNYIMTSGLGALKDNSFMPDTPITRGDVAVLLWKRAGSPEGITAPPVIHRQGSNSSAVSWVYTNGIMVGNDYMDLRLGDTLTRGEASALIIRSRNVNANTPKTNFMASVNPEIFETVYNSLKLVDRPYEENGSITNGELAMASARLLSGFYYPTYPNISATSSFEHEYSVPLNMLCRYYLGLDNDNADYINKNATIKETIAALMFVTARGASAYIPSGKADKNYPGYKSDGNTGFDNLIKRAYYNGVWFDTADNIDFDRDITMKELACLVLELNGFSGYYKVSVVTPGDIKLKSEKILTDLSLYPSNASDYQIILASVPAEVYGKAFINKISMPKDVIRSSYEFRSIFLSMFGTWVDALAYVGYDLKVTYYPEMVVNNGNGYTMRVKIEFTDIPANTRFGDLINCVNSLDADRIVNNGDVIYADVDTGKKIDNVSIGIDDMVLSQIIK